MRNLRIQESREKYYYNSDTKEKKISRIPNFVKSTKMKNSRKFKHAKITRLTVYIENLPGDIYNG